MFKEFEIYIPTRYSTPASVREGLRWRAILFNYVCIIGIRY